MLLRERRPCVEEKVQEHLRQPLGRYADVQSFVDHIARTHGFAESDMAVVAQSVGAVIVATWAHDYAPKVRALVLASPPPESSSPPDEEEPPLRRTS